jgi:hypothetical protein
MKQTHRAWIYRLATALVPITVFYGLLADNEAALWLGVLGAALSTGGHALASANTPTQPDYAIRTPTMPTKAMLYEAAEVLQALPQPMWPAMAAWMREVAAEQPDDGDVDLHGWLGR